MTASETYLSFQNESAVLGVGNPVLAPDGGGVVQLVASVQL